jgi:pilus assembly protein TadC
LIYNKKESSSDLNCSHHNPATAKIVEDPGEVMTSSAICVPNISAKERRWRLKYGLVTLLLGLVILAILLLSGAGRWWRLILIFFYNGAVLGYFQWREAT